MIQITFIFKKTKNLTFQFFHSHHFTLHLFVISLENRSLQYEIQYLGKVSKIFDSDSHKMKGWRF
jgi:hypothetical protein